MAKPIYTIKPYKHPRLKFVVRSKLSGKWERKFFATKGEAQTYVRLKEIELQNQGKEGVLFPSSLRVMAQRESDRLSAFGKTITDAADFYLKHLHAVAKSVPIEQLRSELLQERQAADLSSRYLYDIANRTKKFCDAHPGKLVAEITTAEIETYLQKLKVSKGPRNTHRRDLHTMFTYAVEIPKYCSENPVTKTRKLTADDDDIEILTVAEVQKLLSTASKDMIPFWTIGCFAGLRRAEIERLEWADIDFAEKTIHVHGKRRKTEKSRRFVDMEANLVAWLKPFRGASGKVHPPNLRKRFDTDREAAGMREDWPDNALRHSYASYHLAKFKKDHALALQMGNSVGVIEKHYRQLVKPSQAAAYWKIRPPAEYAKNIIPFAAVKPPTVRARTAS